VTYYVRFEFMWQGERVHEFIGPFDYYFAMLNCVDMASPYLFGMTEVHVLKAIIITGREYEWMTRNDNVSAN
jgi:hypothetical protein